MTTMMRGPGGKYLPAYEIGKPTTGPGVAVVVRSEHASVKAGEHLLGLVEHVRYAVWKDLDNFHVIDNKYYLPWSTFTVVLGLLMRLSASMSYFSPHGMEGIFACEGGWSSTVYLLAPRSVLTTHSPGRGRVCISRLAAIHHGWLVIQLAKADGLKVIASAGSVMKVQFMKDPGADVAFNYKVSNTGEVLKREGPIDI